MKMMMTNNTLSNLSQVWLNESDSALLYLTMESFPQLFNHLEENNVVWMSHFYASFFMFLVFTWFCKWVALIILSFTPLNMRSYFKWVSGVLFFTLIWGVILRYNASTVNLNSSVREIVTFDCLVQSLSNSWTLERYKTWIHAICMVHGRLDVFFGNFWFSCFS